MWSVITAVLLTSLQVKGQQYVRGDTRGPIFRQKIPHQLIFSNNTGADIKCSAEGLPKPKIIWRTKEGIDVTEVNGLRYVRADGSLVFPPFSSTQYRQDVHGSLYYCAASNTVGSIRSTEVQVRGVVHQRYNPNVYDQFIIRGNTAVLRCHLPSFVREYVSVDSWLRDDGVTYTYSEEKESKFMVLLSGELLLHETDESYGTSSFHCKTRHHLTGEYSVSTTSGKIVVTEPHTSTLPRVTFNLSQLRVTQGETAQLPCVAQSYPAPTYKWMKEVRSTLNEIVEGRRIWISHGVLTIKKTKMEDSGKFVCIVKNSAGENRAETNLIVSAPLTAYIQPSMLVIDIGRQATFNCTLTGYPIHSVVWKKDEKLLSPSSRIKFPTKNILHIEAVSREDKGMYQCFVYSDQDSAQGTAELSIGDVAPYLFSTFSEKISKPTEHVTLKCSASGNPLPTLRWLLDGVPVSPSSRISVGDYVIPQGQVVSYINISDVRVEDGGEYQCEASNDVGSIGHKARLNVHGPPFVRPLRNHSVVSGEDLILRCPYGGYPIESITWERGGIVLPLNPRQNVDSKGTFILRNVQRAPDEGEYTCVVRNAVGHSASGTTYISVVVSPVIDAHYFPESVSAVEGSRAKLICSTTTGDPPIKYQWLHDGTIVTSKDDVSVETLEDSSIIIFRRVTSKHKGYYTCLASNSAASSNRTTQFIVNVSPKWIIEPKNTSDVLGNTVLIDCSATGFPIPTITWRKARGNIPSDFTYLYTSSRIRQYGNGSLQIREMEEDDAGYYLCQANNGIGGGLTVVIKLQVRIPPRFEINYRSHTVRTSSDAILKCTVKGEPPLTMEWQKNKETLKLEKGNRYALKQETDKQKTTSELTIKSTSRQDTGLYTCIAKNKFGTDDTNIQLVIQDVPDAPLNLTVTNITSRTVSLQWEVAFNGNSPITGNLVQFKTISENWESPTVQMVVTGSETSALLRSLTPVTSYTIRVITENVLGRSDPSDMINVTTEEEAPAGPPIGILVHSTGAQSLKVTWKPPKEESRHGKIKGYYVGYKIIDSSDSHQYKHVEMSEDAEQQSTYLTNLRPFTKYAVVVQAYNKIGPGPRSDEVVGMTLETAPPTSPILIVTSSTTNSVEVQWEKDSKDKSTITEYILHYKTDEGEWKKKSLSSALDRYTLEGLHCGTTYHLYMTATNSVGTGEPSTPVTVRTRGAPPTSSQRDAFLTINSTFVTLHLNTWQSGGCPIHHFTVQYRPKYQRKWMSLSDKIGPHHGNITTIRQLLPEREYNLMVTAYTDAGVAQEEYEFRTKPTPKLVYATAATSSVKRETELPIHKNITLLIPVVVSITVVIIVIITVAVCLRRYLHDAVNHSSNGYHSRKTYDENLMMAEVSQKMTSQQSMKERGMYCASPTHGQGPNVISEHSEVTTDNHQYAEPYTSVPPPRRVTIESDFRSSMSQRPSMDGTFATIKRNPSRPASRASVSVQEYRHINKKMNEICVM